MKTVKENLKGSEEEKLMLQNFHGKSPKMICKEELHLKARETEKGKEKQAQMVNSQKPNLIPGFLFSAS